jgi:3-hydroxyacyl-CoA dehydrogenase, NAD binding domain
LSRISYAENFQGFADADLVIEAATEDETVKRKISVSLCPFLEPGAIVATNSYPGQASASLTPQRCTVSSQHARFQFIGANAPVRIAGPLLANVPNSSSGFLCSSSCSIVFSLFLFWCSLCPVLS